MGTRTWQLPANGTFRTTGSMSIAPPWSSNAAREGSSRFFLVAVILRISSIGLRLRSRQSAAILDLVGPDLGEDSCDMLALRDSLVSIVAMLTKLVATQANRDEQAPDPPLPLPLPLPGALAPQPARSPASSRAPCLFPTRSGVVSLVSHAPRSQGRTDSASPVPSGARCGSG